jgi:hypothetical protein
MSGETILIFLYFFHKLSSRFAVHAYNTFSVTTLIELWSSCGIALDR